MTENPELFEPYLKAVLSATYHRTAAMMSSPKSVEVLFEGAKWCSQNTNIGGNVEWIIPNRMFIWYEANIFDIDSSTLRFIGIGREIDRVKGRITTKLTIIMRVGWYKLQGY